MRSAEVVAFFLPMHTATRLAMPVIARVRALNPDARLVAYGLYAPLNAPMLREQGVSAIIGGEFEDALVGRPRDPGARHDVDALATRRHGVARSPACTSSCQTAPVCRRSRSTRRCSGETNAGRPVTPKRAAAASTGAATARSCRSTTAASASSPSTSSWLTFAAQVAAGARHITFGDPDFFNGIGHAMALVERFAGEFPGVSYDVTIKVEHLLEHADALPRLRDTGCAFVTTAVEAVDDHVLARLEKGHTRADFERVVARAREVSLTLAADVRGVHAVDDARGLLRSARTIDRLGLVEHVSPIQLAIRLLVTEGSRLLELPDIRDVIGEFNPRR